MAVQFQVRALPYEPFAGLFALSGAEREARGARRVVADSNEGHPCRVSLVDARKGEQLVLLSYTHLASARSPYRSSGPIFVRQGAQQVTPAVREVPELLRVRLLSLRAYDASDMLIDCEVTRGTEIEAAIERLLADPLAAYLHVHNAAPGCYNCRIDRA